MSKIFTKAKKTYTPPKKSGDFLDHILAKKKKIKIFLLCFVGFVVGLLGTLWYFWDEPLLTPLSSLTTFNFLPGINRSQKKKIVYGFLPYWNLNEVTIQPEITHLAYFSLTMGPDGFIITRQDGGQEPGYNKLDSERLIELTNQVSENKDKIEIVLTQFNNDDIVSLLSDPEAHQNLITSLDSILLAYPVSGVNIDIEYTGKVTEKLRNDFVTFMKTLNEHMDKKYNHVQLSIDMYAGAATKEQIWDVEQIAPEVDFIVVMAYDFHRRSSSQAGPVAPLFGGDELWDSDINHHLKNFLTKVPKEKILLGVPFYGYEWQTTSKDPQATTYPDTGSTASYQRVQEILKRRNELNVEEHWHETALSPYLTYTEDGENWTIYYENARSISYKMEYVHQLDLAGIAIWALGYEGDTRELWDQIDFAQNNE
jgi:spore germination protein YaaH